MLQPLLGITNSLQMMAAPYDKNLTYFALWSFITTFLVSFQGFFASLFYCFLNGEVNMTSFVWCLRYTKYIYVEEYSAKIALNCI